MKHVCCLTSWNLHDVCFEWNGTSFWRSSSPPKVEDNRTKRFHVWNVNQPQQQSEPAISHTHIFCSGLSGIQTFMFAMATSILSIILFPPCQICRVSDFCGVDKNRQKTTTGRIKNAHQKHTHIYPSIHQSIYARHVSWQSSLLKCGNNFKSSFVLPLPSPSFS